MRSDDHHVDSCWMTWNHPETRMKLTTYPMLHIGDARYCERLSGDLDRCQYALIEGVTWRLGNARRPMYDLVARNLGVATQELALQIPASAIQVNLDMARSEFRARFFNLPLRYVAIFVFLRPLLWALTLPRPLRSQFVRSVLRRPRRPLSIRPDTPWHRLIVGARDRRIVENLSVFFREHGQTDTTTYGAIIFGVGHMPAIRQGLRQLGFQVGTRRWVEVFRTPVDGSGVA